MSSDFLKPYQTTPSIDQSGVIPGFTKLRSQYYNPDGTLNQEKFKAANFVAGMTPNEFEYKDTRTGDIYGPSTYASIAAGMYPDIYNPNQKTTTTPTQTNYGSPGSIYTDSGNTYYVGKDGLPYNVTGINLENFKVQGENSDGSFYTKYNIPSSVYGLANGGLATMFSEKR